MDVGRSPSETGSHITDRPTTSPARRRRGRARAPRRRRTTTPVGTWSPTPVSAGASSRANPADGPARTKPSPVASTPTIATPDGPPASGGDGVPGPQHVERLERGAVVGSRDGCRRGDDDAVRRRRAAEQRRTGGPWARGRGPRRGVDRRRGRGRSWRRRRPTASTVPSARGHAAVSADDPAVDDHRCERLAVADDDEGATCSAPVAGSTTRCSPTPTTRPPAATTDVIGLAAGSADDDGPRRPPARPAPALRARRRRSARRSRLPGSASATVASATCSWPFETIPPTLPSGPIGAARSSATRSPSARIRAAAYVVDQR